MAANRTATLRSNGATKKSVSGQDQNQVARVAYELYEQRGRADGHDLDDWLKAEAIVRQRKPGR